MPEFLPVAVVGMGGVFPDAATPAALWRHVLAARDTSREPPPGRWVLPPEVAHAPGEVRPDRVPSVRACYVDSIELDLSGMDIDPDLVRQLDPVFHLALAAGGQAWRSASTATLDRTRVGVILGAIALPTDATSALTRKVLGATLAEALGRPDLFDEPWPHPMNRHATGMPATLLAKALGLGGTAYTLDAACASSLYAIKLACDELQSGRADAMLAGGLSRPDSLYTQMGFAQLRAVSPSGRCSPFDVRADGLIVGEGAGVFVLKRLEDAVRDGDRVLGVIRGIGLSNDIGGGLLAPANEGQLRAMRTAYEQAGWRPDEVGLIECHATGTPVGDAVELRSLHTLWEGHAPGAGAVIGSVKSSVGHLLTGAGAAALTKVLFAMNEGVLPPTANHDKAAHETRPFRVLSRPEAWGGRRRAAVSAFGFGGINAHLLIDVGEPGALATGVRGTPPVANAPGSPAVAVVAVASDVTTRSAPPSRWWGVERSAWYAREGFGEIPGRYRAGVTVPAGAFRIPPREVEEMLPQQALLLPVARRALLEAKLGEGTHPDVGVFVGAGLDLNTTNFHLRWSLLRDAPEAADAVPPLDANRTMGALASIAASRVAREFRLGGPSFTISAGDDSGLKALEAAAHALERGELNAALVAAVDLPGDVRDVLNRHREGHREETTDAAVAVVLKRLDDARRDGDRVYAVLDGEPAVASTTYAGEATGLLAFAEACRALCTRRLGGVPWLRDRAGGPRRLGSLVEGDFVPDPIAPRETLYVYEADDAAGLLARLASGQCQPHVRTSNLAVCLIARDDAEHARLVETASEHLRRSPHEELMRDRILYTPAPLRGEVAFVFPASGNDFPGMGRDIALRFPELLKRQDRENEYLRSQFADGDRRTVQDRIFAQVALGTLVADALALLGVKPSASIGCSLGESSALFALRAWPDRDEMLARMHASTLFVSDLTGRSDAARAAWDLGVDEEVDWLTGIVERGPDEVRAAMAGIGRVYLQIIHSPRECVVGGQRGAVGELTRRLGCALINVPQTTTMHGDVMEPVAGAYRDLHVLPMSEVAGVRFYSAGLGRVVPLDSDAWADAILTQARRTIDFASVIEAAYRDGVRLFVEVGPGASCSRLISTILAGRPHAARSACVAGADGLAALWRVAAMLVAHRVPVRLDVLQGHAEERDEGGIVVPVGGEAFRLAATRRGERGGTHDAAERAPLRVAARQSPVAAAHLAYPAEQIARVADVVEARGAAHAAYLRLSDSLRRTLADTLAAQSHLFSAILDGHTSPSPVALDRAQCMEFAVGSIGRVLGPAFAEIDTFPTRVRLPDEPLMLVDRILTIEGEPLSLTRGRVVTEHDIHPGAWYLDNERIPTCLAVESGQADLFLSGYLGIDLRTRGLAVYRLLDACVTFHRGLPGPGEVIRYDIHIDSFFRQGETHLFRFRFLGTVNGEPLLTMSDGIAGFFTGADLAAGKGVVHTAIRRQQRRGVEPDDRADLPPVAVERYDEVQVDALRRGDLAACFGPSFGNLALREPMRLPGGRMRLVHRVTELDPRGGRFGIGLIRAEADVRPDDWFLTCHFVDDQVMPGTLMYECCLHTLRVLLMRMGWVGEHAEVGCEPVPGVTSRLACRGQVTASTRVVTYEVTLKERGYRPEPYVVCDALMYADGKAVVDITDMSLRLTGLTRESVAALWRDGLSKPDAPARGSEALAGASGLGRRPLYDRHHIIAFATGKPSEAFGDRYRVFDEEREIARLPADPYRFVDRISAVTGEPWVMVAGGKVDAEYDVPPAEWYFGSERSGVMPFAVLLEAALQVCGWMSSYIGSALTSDKRLHYRNLGGTATMLRPITPASGTLRTHVETTRVSSSGGMIIQEFTFDLHDDAGRVYQGNTMFGFFSPEALAQQLGVRDATLHAPTADELSRSKAFDLPRESPMPDDTLRMMDRVDVLVPDGGPAGLGFIQGSKSVRADEWFFRAHFYQDPVWPGSLGLEAMLQLMKVVAVERWGGAGRFVCNVGTHRWQYRGQVLPTNRRVEVQASVTAIDDERRRVTAGGYLVVDGLVIYRMSDFVVEFWQGR